MAYAKGKYAKFISDRSGMEYPYTEMVVEWNGSRVHTSEFEPKTPQDNPKRHTSDAEPLQFPRPARTESAVATLLPRNPFRFTASSTTVSVFEPDHGRSSSDTVRCITKTDDDFYTFTVSTAPGITGNGGGGYASAGPTTLSN